MGRNYPAQCGEGKKGGGLSTWQHKAELGLGWVLQDAYDEKFKEDLTPRSMQVQHLHLHESESKGLLNCCALVSVLLSEPDSGPCWGETLSRMLVTNLSRRELRDPVASAAVSPNIQFFFLLSNRNPILFRVVSNEPSLIETDKQYFSGAPIPYILVLRSTSYPWKGSLNIC